MKKAPIPLDDAWRLAELTSLALLDTPAEERFDCITRLASRLFRVPISLVSLVDETRQWFKSAQGLATLETSRELSFCGHAILDDGTFVVPDAQADPRFMDNPLVTGPPRIRFYAGCPVRTAAGARVGTLCVIDHEPRTLDAEDERALRDFGRLVEREVAHGRLVASERELLSRLTDLQRRAATDALTRLWNREQGLHLLASEHARAVRTRSTLAVAMLDVDHFKSINDRCGHPVGDEVLRTVSDRLRQSLRPYDLAARYGGEEFLIVLPECPRAKVRLTLERVLRELAARPAATAAGPVAVTASAGFHVFTPDETTEAAGAIVLADRALYEAKAAGRNCVRGNA